jgi:hypothetical protein
MNENEQALSSERNSELKAFFYGNRFIKRIRFSIAKQPMQHLPHTQKPPFLRPEQC